MEHSVSRRRIFSTPNLQIVNQINVFSSVDTSWSAAACQSVDRAGVSELFCSLLMLLFVHLRQNLQPATIPGKQTSNKNHQTRLLRNATKFNETTSNPPNILHRNSTESTSSQRIHSSSGTNAF